MVKMHEPAPMLARPVELVIVMELAVAVAVSVPKEAGDDVTVGDPVR